ncbi:MAG: acyl-coenzyme A synthetase/AMP-(fatty) acid ligase [Gammaproteobacteria bacterium]|jgi:acyl-coenzyme A synthetase/AMP-(fatty) acid ligase
MQFGISESINHWATYKSKKNAIYSNGIPITYGLFNSRINFLSKKIIELNPDAPRIGLAIKSKIDLIVSILSVIRTGKSIVLLNVNLPNEALKTNIEDTELDLLIHDDYIDIDDLCKGSSVKTMNISGFFDNVNRKIEFKAYNSEPEDEWAVLFSSGTTGTPKGIERDHNSMVTEFLGWCLELGLSKSTNFYIGRPIYYTGGLVLALSTFIVGGSIIINDYDDSNNFELIWDDYIKTLESIEMEWTFFIPDQLKLFCSKVEERNIKMTKSTENILVMGAPISSDLKIRANGLLGSNIIESWGNTESLGTITQAEDLFIRPDSIGRPFLTDELYILDDNLKELPKNTIGRIAGNEEGGFSKYSNRPSETDRIKQNDLIVSDDLGYMDDDGYFYIKGRIQDRIIINGSTFFTADIEEYIKKLSTISNCCIVFKGTQSFEGMCVAVTLEKDMEQSASISQVNALLNKYNLPFNTIKIMENLPRLAAGKVDKIELLKAFSK